MFGGVVHRVLVDADSECMFFICRDSGGSNWNVELDDDEVQTVKIYGTYGCKMWVCGEANGRLIVGMDDCMGDCINVHGISIRVPGAVSREVYAGVL